MKNRILGAVALPAALVALSGCVYDDFSYGGWNGSYGAVGVGYSSGYPGYSSPGYYQPYGYGPAYYDAYYDNFYGPIYGGYWHNDGLFYYQSYFGGPWYCDYSRHFRRESFRGGNRYRFEDRREPGQVVTDTRNYVGGRGQGPGGGNGYAPGNGVRGGVISGLQGNPGPAPQQGGRNRGGAIGAINGLLGGPGGSVGNGPEAPAGAAAAPAPRGNAVGRVQNTLRGNRGGDDDGGGVSRGQSSERSAPAPRSAPPPPPRPNAIESVRDRLSGRH
jgi:hypothetical protein